MTKRDISKLLKKQLTGRQAARLAMQNHVEINHRREPLLTKEAILQMTDETEADEFYRWLGAYDIIYQTLQEANIYALELREQLHGIVHYLRLLNFSYIIKQAMIFRPTVVTEKQYEDLKQEHWRSLMEKIYSLLDVVRERLYEVATPQARDESSDDIDILAQEHPELLKVAAQQAIGLLKAGKLQPVELTRAEDSKLGSIQQRMLDVIGRDLYRSTKQRRELAAVLRKLQRAFYLAAQARSTGEEMAEALEMLEHLASGERALQDEPLRSHLDRLIITGEELYKTGLPEWTDETELRRGRPFSDDPLPALPAILQAPEPRWLDERGYYRDTSSQLLDALADDELEATVDGFSKAIDTSVAKAKELLKAFLAIQTVIEQISTLTGVQFGEDLPGWHERMLRAVEQYNESVRWVRNREETLSKILQVKARTSRGQVSTSRTPVIPGNPKLSPINAKRLAAPADAVAFYRDRLAVALGENWWTESPESFLIEEDALEPEETA